MTPFEALVESLAVSGITDQEAIVTEATRRNVAVDVPPVVEAQLEEKASEE